MVKNLLLIFLCLFFFEGYSQGITIVSPKDNYDSPSFTVDFSWNPFLNLTSYRLTVSSNAAFTNIVKDTVVNNTSLTVTFNTSVTRLYWKVASANSAAFVQSAVISLNFVNPVQNPNLLLWLAADSGVTTTAGAVTNWKNLATPGNDAAQGNTANSPALALNIPQLNGKPVVRFTGGTQQLLTPAGGPIANSYALANYTGGTNFSGGYPGLLTNNVIASLGSNYIFEGAGNSNAMYLNSYYPTGYLMNNVPKNTFAPMTDYKVISARKSVPTSIYTGFSVGRDPVGDSWKGDIGEVIVSKFSGPGEADSTHTYLYNKYAPPVSLGKDVVFGSSFSDSFTLHAGVRFVSFLWSTVGIAESINITTAGTYSVKVKDIFGRESEDEIQVYPYRRFNNRNVYLCSGDSLILNTGLSSPFTFLWSTNATTSSIVVKTTGTYTVAIHDFKGQEVLDTINVFIGSPVLSPPLPVSHNINLCFNEKLFVTTPASFDSILWSNGTTGTFITVTDSGTYSVFARSVNGCILNETFHVSIAGRAPVANFGTSPLCEDAVTSFTDSSTAPPSNFISNWKWTFGDGNSAFTPNATNIYANPGSFIASLKVTTNAGCSDSIAKTVLVNLRPVAHIAPRGSCAGLPTLFVDASLPFAAAITDWAWQFDGGLPDINGIQNPSVIFPAAGVYNVRLKVTNSNQCQDTSTTQVTVDPSPVANFAFDSVCGKNEVHFKWLSTVDPPAIINNFDWDFGDINHNISSKDPSHAYDAPGVYDVTLTVFANNACYDTATRRVKVFEFPIVDFDVSQTQCTGKEIQFTDISTTPDGVAINKWNWFFSGQATSTEQNPKYTFPAEGNYTIQLTAANEVGCTGTKLRSIAVSAPPTPKFNFSPQNGNPPLTVSYFNQSPANGNYFWDYGDNSGPLIQAYNPPPHTYTVRGTYPIKLIATDFRGCTDTLTKFILVDKAYLDAVMATINIIPNGDFYQVQVTIINSSNIEIRDMGLSLQIGGGAVIRENWTGSLLPGKSVSYTFTGQIKLSDVQIPVICANIDNVNNNSPEDRTDNNTACKEVRIGQFDILNVYPNPAYENINFGIMLPQDGILTIGFVDMLGQVMYKSTFSGVKGYNNISMMTSVLNSAVYVAVVEFNGETIRKKFIKRGR